MLHDVARRKEDYRRTMDDKRGGISSCERGEPMSSCIHVESVEATAPVLLQRDT